MALSNFFSKFCFYIKSVSKDASALIAELNRLDESLNDTDYREPESERALITQDIAVQRELILNLEVENYQAIVLFRYHLIF